MGEFQGVYPAIITPMTPQDELNEEVFRKVMEFNIQAGVHGFWVAGGSGESIFLDDVENNRLAEIAVDQAKDRAKIIMHVGAPTTKRAARMAEHAARTGVDAICCIPAFFYSHTDEDIVKHFRAVAAAADLPFFVYNLPTCTGVEITPELMAKIQEGVPQLAGLKHSGLNFSHVRTFTEMELACFIGRGAWMLPALIVGAVGCIDGTPNIAPEPWVETWQAYQEGDLKRAQIAQEKCLEVTKLIRFERFHAIMKTVLSERLGVDCGNPRPPGQPLTKEERKALVRRLHELDLIKKR